MVALPAFAGLFGGIGGLVFVGIWCGVIAPMALRDLWKADTLFVPRQRSAPPPNPVGYDGTRLPSLSDYVASQPKPPTT